MNKKQYQVPTVKSVALTKSPLLAGTTRPTTQSLEWAGSNEDIENPEGD